MGLHTSHQSWTDAQWNQALEHIPTALMNRPIKVIASTLDNTPAFVAVDDWARHHGWVHVPLPLFFTPAQMLHAVEAAGADTWIGLSPYAALWPQKKHQQVECMGEVVIVTEIDASQVPVPPMTQTITFTSGTTGAPKGVCLSEAAMQAVAKSLADEMAPLQIKRHLNALPFAVLLENIAGLRTPRLAGADVWTVPLGELGWKGASVFDAEQFHKTVLNYRPQSLILLPQMLRAWCGYLTQNGKHAPPDLRLVAVGGAPVGLPLLRTAHHLGLPVVEGYGLSEGASVQCLNNRDTNRPGSVGRLLPHTKARVADDGELWIQGSLMEGYLGDSSPAPTEWPTGDLASIDSDGYVFIAGRKKNVLITSFGRNVSPEWVETLLRSEPSIREAVVLGDGMPHLSAVLWPHNEQITDSDFSDAVRRINAELPDYARIGNWHLALKQFNAETGMSTANGRPCRDAIFQTHAQVLGLFSSQE